MTSNIICIHGKKGHGKDTVAKIWQILSIEDNRVKSDLLREFLENPNTVITNQSPYRVVKFAAKLKQMAATFLGVDVSMFEDEDYKNTPLGPEWDRWMVEYELGDRWVVYGSYTTADEGSAALNELFDINPDLYARNFHRHLTPRAVLQTIGTEWGRTLIHPDCWLNATLTPDVDFVLVPDTRFPNEANGGKARGAKIVSVYNPRKLAVDQHPSEIALDDYDGFDAKIINDSTLPVLVARVSKVMNEWTITNSK